MSTPVEDVLAGRDERASVQSDMLCNPSEGGPQFNDRFICQIALNIPGYPKREPFDFEAIEKCRLNILRDFALIPIAEKRLMNGSGYCWIGLFRGDRKTAENAKILSVSIEEKSQAWRVFDIDIITSDGSISRDLMGLPPRKCLLCNNNAKVCARSRKHPIEELRMETKLLISSVCKII